MTTFSRISCAALTWDSAGECRGVLVQGRGDRLRIRACWQARAGSDSPVAECLRDGLAALGARDSVFVVAGAADAACGLADVEVPALRPAELRGALGFELARHCPLPAERVAWGYRVLPGNAARTRLPVRLFYLRQTAWERWVEAVGGLKLDAIVPPQAVLDPVLAGSSVVLPLAGGGAFQFAPDGSAHRAVSAVPEPEEGADRPGPLAWDWVQPGPLAGFPAGDQASFTSAVLLGAYGASSTFHADRVGLLPVPYNLQPRRNRLNRFLAVAMAVAIVALGVVAVWREYAARASCLAALRERNAEVQRQIGVAEQGPVKSSESSLEALSKEMRESGLELRRPSLAAVLVELTETLGKDSWCYKLDWREGKVDVELEEAVEDVDLVRNLEMSPAIGDVVEQSKGPAHGKITRKITMNARWDIDADETPRETPRKPDPATIDLPPVPGAGTPEGPEALLPRGRHAPGAPPKVIRVPAPKRVPPHLMRKEQP